LWQNCGDYTPNGDHDVIAEAWLLVRDPNGRPVTQEGGWHTCAFLNVSLVEKLVEKKVGPLTKRFKLASWRGKIRGMDHEVEDLLLTGKLICLVCILIDY